MKKSTKVMLESAVSLLQPFVEQSMRDAELAGRKPLPRFLYPIATASKVKVAEKATETGLNGSALLKLKSEKISVFDLLTAVGASQGQSAKYVLQLMVEQGVATIYEGVDWHRKADGHGAKGGVFVYLDKAAVEKAKATKEERKLERAEKIQTISSLFQPVPKAKAKKEKVEKEPEIVEIPTVLGQIELS